MVSNLSSRIMVGTGESIALNALIISGPVPKRVIVRGIGPSLGAFGIPDPLADPVMELHGPSGFATISNDNWRDTQEAEIMATGLAPTNDLESAIVATLDPGSYTVIVKGRNNGTGIALNEVYDLTPNGSNYLSAVGTRAQVLTDADVLIGGFIIPGTQPTQLLLRGLGPSLANVGIPTVLADPVMELHGPSGFTTITNHNWRDTQEAQILATGLAPTNDLESAIVATLNPGDYTVILRGNNNTTGIGYVQVYTLPHSGPELPLTCPSCGP